MNHHSLEVLIDEKELTGLIQVSIATPCYSYSEDKGPRFRKVGQMVRCAPSDVVLGSYDGRHAQRREQAGAKVLRA